MEESGEKFTEGQRNNINKIYDIDDTLRGSKPHLKIGPQEMNWRKEGKNYISKGDHLQISKILSQWPSHLKFTLKIK